MFLLLIIIIYHHVGCAVAMKCKFCYNLLLYLWTFRATTTDWVLTVSMVLYLICTIWWPRLYNFLLVIHSPAYQRVLGDNWFGYYLSACYQRASNVRSYTMVNNNRCFRYMFFLPSNIYINIDDYHYFLPVLVSLPSILMS